MKCLAHFIRRFSDAAQIVEEGFGVRAGNVRIEILAVRVPRVGTERAHTAIAGRLMPDYLEVELGEVLMGLEAAREGAAFSAP